MTADKEKYRFRVRWEPFLLRPGIPPEGIVKPPNMIPNPGNNRVDRLVQAGKAVGIDFTYKCDRFPYTVPSHALLEWVKEKDNKDGSNKQNDLSEILFQAYFTDGIYPDADALCDLAEKVGLSKEETRTIVTDETNLKKAAEKATSWSQKGVTGVPCFFINGKEAFSGAQDSEAFRKVFKIVAEKFPLQNNL